MHALRRFILTLLGVLLALVGGVAPPAAHAQSLPPSWDQVVGEAELIVRAEVVEPGRFGARVVARETFYGQAPDQPFLVIGFNDSSFPPEIIDLESMRTGETVWLLLQRWPGFRPDREIPNWLEEDWRPEPGVTWTTGSPITGDVPLRGGKVHANLVMAGFHHTAPTLSTERWESLLRAMIDRVKHDRIDSAGLQRARACLDEGVQPQRENRRGETAEARCLAELWLRGQRTMDPRMEGFRAAPTVARGVLAGLAAHAGDPSYDDLIRELAVAEDPEGAATMLAVARDGAQDHVARVIAPMLAASRASTSPYPGISLATLRQDATRSRLLAILADLGSEAVVDQIVAELHYLNPESLYVGIDAAERARSQSWVPTILEFVDQAEPRRTTVSLEAIEAHRADTARDALHAFIERDDVDPGLQRLAMRVLGQIGNAQTAARLRARLQERLDFRGAWDDDRVDAVGAELEALEALVGARAADLAWIVARQYIGQPQALVDTDFLTKLEAERDTLRKSVLQALPAGSQARVQVVFEREDAFESRGQRVVLVDVTATGGVSEALRAEIARRAGTEPEHVRLCGPDLRKRVRCIRTRGAFWERHPRLVRPALLAIGAQAGLGPRAAQHPDPTAGRWLAIAEARGWIRDIEADHIIDDLWGPRFQGPFSEDDRPPLVPPDLPPFDPTAPGR